MVCGIISPGYKTASLLTGREHLHWEFQRACVVVSWHLHGNEKEGCGWSSSIWSHWARNLQLDLELKKLIML